MRNFWTLTKMDFRAMLSAFSFGRSRKRVIGGGTALAFLCGLSLYLSLVYGMQIMSALGGSGMLRYYLPVMTLYCWMMALLMTAFAAGGLLYGGHDNDFMLSLPVSNFCVLAARVAALYLELLAFCGVWMIPAYVTLFMAQGMGANPVLTVLRCLVCIVAIPFVPAVCSALLGLLFTWFSARTQNSHNIFSSILYLAMFAGLFALMMQINRLPELLTKHSDAMDTALRTWLLPLGMLQASVGEGRMGASLLLLWMCVVLFCLVTWLLSLRYKQLLTALSSHTSRSDYRLHGVHAQGQFSALFKKEAGRLFGTPIYLFNTCFGVLVMLGGSVYLCVARARVMPLVEAIGGVQALPPLLALVMCFFAAVSNTACVSISLEGKTLWILKEAPVPVQTLLGAKALLNIAVVLIPAWVALLAVTPTFGLPALPMLAAVLVSAAFTVLVALGGLWANLLLPKMDCPNDAIVVKQSASSVVAVLGGMVVAGVLAVVYLFIGRMMGFVPFALVLTAVLAALDFALWRRLCTHGAQRLAAL